MRAVTAKADFDQGVRIVDAFVQRDVRFESQCCAA